MSNRKLRALISLQPLPVSKGQSYSGEKISNSILPQPSAVAPSFLPPLVSMECMTSIWMEKCRSACISDNCTVGLVAIECRPLESMTCGISWDMGQTVLSTQMVLLIPWIRSVWVSRMRKRERRAQNGRNAPWHEPYLARFSLRHIQLASLSPSLAMLDSPFVLSNFA